MSTLDVSVDKMSIADENTKVDNNIINAVSNNILCKTVTSSDKKTAAAEHSVLHFGIEICANCGKEGDEVKNICNKCKKATYCNAACKKKHRHKHKKDCEEHQRLAAKLHDEKLFKQPPPKEDCSLCFIRLPIHRTGSKYNACCGKTICSGCSYAPVYDNQGNIVAEKKCPFCRAPCTTTDEDHLQRLKKRVEANDPIAIHNEGCDYRVGRNGFPQDYAKALELWHRAGELGYAVAYNNIGYAYDYGEGVEVDKKKAAHYYELAAMGGNVIARSNLGNNEVVTGNIDRALKHFVIAAGSGNTNSLKQIRILYTNGHATVDDDTKALRLYQAYLGEIKSKQRDEAAAADGNYRYY